jgi:hypothetical protein
LSLLGISAEVGVAVLRALGFGAVIENEALTFSTRPTKGHKGKGRRKPSTAKAETPTVVTDSPFANLKSMLAVAKAAAAVESTPAELAVESATPE